MSKCKDMYREAYGKNKQAGRRGKNLEMAAEMEISMKRYTDRRPKPGKANG